MSKMSRVVLTYFVEYGRIIKEKALIFKKSGL
jgi:hypothetical protein